MHTRLTLVRMTVLALTLIVTLLVGVVGFSAETVDAARKPTPTPTPRPPTSTPAAVPGSWKVVNSPNLGGGSNQLNGVAVVSANDIWAVGSADGQTLTMRWNGANWSVVPNPNPPGLLNTLSGVAAISSNDVWAVGTANLDTTVIMHWDGTSWTRIPSPNVPGELNTLTGVTAIASNDVWAVGYVSGTRTLTLHWDGVSWSIVPSANPSTRPYNYLYGVTAVATNNVWAVGSYAPVGRGPLSLVERWNGSAWSVVPSPNQVGNYGQEIYNRLLAVDAVSANDIWAVGTAGNQSLIQRWNGSSWSIVPSPNVPFRENFLTGVAAISANDVWAVGYAQRVAYGGGGEVVTYYPNTLIMHWDGLGWSIVPSPNPSPVEINRLAGVAAVSASNVWAVGWFSNGSVFRTLTERYTIP